MSVVNTDLKVCVCAADVQDRTCATRSIPLEADRNLAAPTERLQLPELEQDVCQRIPAGPVLHAANNKSLIKARIPRSRLKYCIKMGRLGGVGGVEGRSHCNVMFGL